MTVAYAPPIPSWHVDERVETEVLREGPAYIRGPRSTRWHRVRSAELTLRSWEPDEIRRHWTLWCGPGVHDRKYEPWLTDEPPAGEPRCGTCEGRWRGVQPDSEWLFTPYAEPPKVCPGSQRREFASDDATPFAGRCLVCGDYVKMRAYGGAYRGDWGPQRHVPGDGLIASCEVHGWKRLTRRGDMVTCQCQVLAHLRTRE